MVNIAMDALPPQLQTMTVPEFLAWEPGDGRRWQLVDGVPRAMAPTVLRHGFIQNELARLIGNYLDAQGSPCHVVPTPGVQPRVNGGANFRIPDLAVTCTPCDDTAQMLQDAVLLIEVLSPSNHAETWSNVWTYTSLPSVQEILVVRTAAVGADLLRRGSDGAWPDTPAPVGEQLVLDSIGFSTPLRLIYRHTALA